MREIIPFQIQVISQCVIITGDLYDTPDIVQQIQNTLQGMKRGLWIIDADDARVFPGGDGVWIEAVNQYLMDSHLVYGPSEYGPSELALKMFYDDRYTHQYSTFLPDENF